VIHRNTFAAMLPSTDEQEREMTKHQRGLVDTCFEEGHYESGISILDQLRSSQFRPSE
jgi:pentatricopeptide repeat protein